jgi:hypothetical protein
MGTLMDIHITKTAQRAEDMKRLTKMVNQGRRFKPTEDDKTFIRALFNPEGYRIPEDIRRELWPMFEKLLNDCD